MTKITFLSVGLFCLFATSKLSSQNNPNLSAGNGFRMHGAIKMGNNAPGGKHQLTNQIPQEQLVAQTTFFKGDTLNGYDHAGILNNAINRFKIFSELKVYMHRSEIAFVKKKYNIAELPIEKARNNAKIINPPTVMASACNNTDFENGNMGGGWTGGYGYNDNSAAPMTVTTPVITTVGNNANVFACNAYHTITTSAGGNDYYAGAAIPMLYPGGGSYSVRLGNEDMNLWGDGTISNDCTVNNTCLAGDQVGGGSGAEYMQQTFVVAAASTLFSFNYAAVLVDGAHNPGEQPYFEITVTDSVGNLIGCFSQHVELLSGVAPPGGYDAGITDDCAAGELYIVPWQTSSLDLAGYINHQITVKFTAAGCIYGAHFGYAYFDASCGSTYQITASNNSPCVGTNVTLSVPPQPGQTYVWSGPGVVSSSGNTATVNATGTYTVTIGTGGCAYTVTKTITFVAKPTVTVNSPTVCAGSSVNLTAAGASTYTWNTGSTANPLSVTPGATSYTVTGTNAAGCTNTAVSTVTVVAKPTVTVNSPTVCTGSSVNLTGAGASTYTWNTGSTANPLSVTPGATSYTVTGTSAAGCTNMAVSTVTVVVKPTVTVNSPTVCTGSSVNLTGAGASTYTWNTGSTANPLSVTPGATSYTVTGTSAAGCTNTAVSTVTVVALPTVTVNSPTVCSGSSVNLTAAGASTYTWNTGSTANPLSVTPGATSYTVTGTSAAGCANTAVSTVTVVAKPTVTVNSPTVCSGSSVNLTATGASTYTWNTGSTANPLSVTPGATSYTVTGTSAAGCTNTAVSTVTVVAKPTVTVNSPTVCTGSSVNLTAAGASTYTWNTGSTANPLSITPGATSYTVTGTSAAGCTNTAVSTATVVALPTVTVNSPTVCSGSSVNLTAAGASTYTWNTGSTANPLSVTPGATSYTVTGTSAAGCTNTVVSTVTVVALPTVTVNSPTVCSGSSVNLTATGASTYTWNTGSTANPLSVTPGATSYTVTGTSAAGCANTAVSTVTVVAKPTVTVNSPTVCSGSSVNLTAAGASTYTWNTGSTANPLSVTPGATSFTVTGTSAAGCTNTAVSTVTVVANPTVTVNSPTVCAGSSVNLTAAGASTYTWNTGSTTNPLSVTPGATSYTVTGTSAAGCTNTDVSTVTVVANPTVTVNSPTVCAGSSVNLTAAGATTYTWNTGSTTNPLSVTPGATSYTVTGTTAGCTNTAVLTVTVVALPTYSLTSNSYTICNGGSQTFTVSGASTYTWTNPATLTGANTANPTASPTTTTVYSVTGTSASACSNLTPATVTVTVNPKPTFTLTGNAYTICNGGSQTFTVSGASTYTWTPAATLTGANTANPTASPTTTTVYSVTGTSALGCSNLAPATVTVNVTAIPIMSLAANSYTICNGGSQMFSANGVSTYTWTPAATLTNPNISNPIASPTTTTIYTVNGTASGCAQSAPLTVTLTVNPLPTYSLASNSYTICNGSSQTFTVSGASTYTWTNPATLTGANTANPTASPTTTTVYSVTGTSASACSNLTPATVTVTVNPKPTYTLSGNAYTICNGGSQTFSVSGASTYTWTPATTLTGANTANPTASPTTTTVYSVTGTSALSCGNLTPATVTVNVTAIPSMSLAASSYTICNGGSQTFTVSGASTYTWTNPATLTGASTATPTANPTTTTIYTVNGTASGCAQSAPLTVTLTVNPLPTYSLASNSYTICNGASQGLSVSGASTYTWTPAASLTGANTATPTASPTTTTVYSVTGTSASACSNLVPATVTITVNQLPTYSLTSNAYTICNGGSQTFSVSGASSYTWTPSATLDNGNIATPTASPTTTTVYSVTGTDANACTNLTPATVTVNVTAVPSMSLTANSYTICNGGSQTFTVSGASTYTWTPIATLDNSTIANPTANPTTTTVYTVNGTASGCAQSAPLTVTLTVNPLPTYSLASNSYTICNGASQGLSISGASSYTWTPSATLDNGNIATPTASPTTTTVYSVTGTDANACSNLIPATVTVNVNPLPTYSLTGNVYTICNGGSQTLSVSGASSYTWTPAATLDNANIANPTASPTTTTVYSVIGTDANACTNLTPATVTVNVTSVPSMSLTASSYTICNGGSQTFTVSGASSYTWTPAATLDNANIASPTANPTTTTIYTVNGVASGCAPSPALTVTLTVNPTPTISIAPLGSNSVICNGASVVITPSVNPNSAATYTLNPGNQVGTSFTVSPTSSITYTINATDGTTGCPNASAGAAIIPITVNPTPTITINPLGSNSVICNGASVVITPTGATSYTLNPGNQTGTSFTVSPTSSTTYTINGSDGTTTCQNATSDAASVPITVNPTPTITINPLGSNSVICNGGSVVITPSGATTYTLNPGNQTGTSFTVSPTGSITYTINGSNGTTACQNATSDAASIPITVNPTPTISINPLGSNSVICNGGSVVITPSGATTYTLNPGNQTGTSFTVSPTSSTTYTINGSDGTTTCQNATADAGLVPITVNPTPTISINPLGGNGVICNGGSAVITPSGATSYTLNPGNLTGTSFTVSPSSSTTYTIDGSNSVTGCSNAITGAAIIPITVNPTPTISIAPLGSNSVICSGVPVVITPSGATTYTLNPGNQTGTSFTVNPTSNTTYTISGSDGTTSCTNASANSALAPIMVNQTPTLSVSSATVATANCGQTTGGVSGIDNNSVSGGAAPYNYQWTSVSTGSVVSTTSTLSNQGLGTYSLLVTDANGCVANVTGGSSTFTVPASAAIQAGMANSNPTTGTVPLAVSFTNTSHGATNYTWSFGDGDTSTAVNPTNTYTNAGTYTVVLTAINGACSDTHTITVIANVPTTLIIPNVFSPNGDGTNDEFFIPNTGMASLNCDIFNRWGQLLYTITAPNQGWDGITPNGDKAPEGTYLYLLVAKGLDGQTYKQQGTVMLVR
jgi:gliding motility-associated-like protein